MKHILNDLTKEEKNSILEQYTGGKKIMIENFNKLVNSTLGDSKPLLEEQVQFTPNGPIGTAKLQIDKEYLFDVILGGRKVAGVAMRLIGTNSPETNAMSQKYLTSNNQYYFEPTDDYDYKGLKKGVYYYTPNNEGPGYGKYTPSESLNVGYYLERLNKPNKPIDNRIGKAKLVIGKEYLFDVFNDYEKKMGQVSMIYDSMAHDEEGYVLKAKNKSQYPKVKDGEYTYLTNLFNYSDGPTDYYLKLSK
jgi:hypothetical protein